MADFWQQYQGFFIVGALFAVAILGGLAKRATNNYIRRAQEGAARATGSIGWSGGSPCSDRNLSLRHVTTVHTTAECNTASFAFHVRNSRRLATFAA